MGQKWGIGPGVEKPQRTQLLTTEPSKWLPLESTNFTAHTHGDGARSRTGSLVIGKSPGGRAIKIHPVATNLFPVAQNKPVKGLKGQSC